MTFFTIGLEATAGSCARALELETDTAIPVAVKADVPAAIYVVLEELPGATASALNRAVVGQLGVGIGPSRYVF